MAKPARFDIHLTAGDDYTATVKLLEDGSLIDTSSYTWRAQVRTAPLPRGELVAEFGVDPIAGGVDLSLSSEHTRPMVGRGGLVWDLQSSSPDVRTWLSGSVQVTPEVTE